MSSPEKLGIIVTTFLSDKGYSSVCKEIDVVSCWNEIVGDKIASVTECDKVDNGILYVFVKTASWRQEIVFLKKDILRKIKSEYNCLSINDVVFL